MPLTSMIALFSEKNQAGSSYFAWLDTGARYHQMKPSDCTGSVLYPRSATVWSPPDGGSTLLLFTNLGTSGALPYSGSFTQYEAANSPPYDINDLDENYAIGSTGGIYGVNLLPTLVVTRLRPGRVEYGQSLNQALNQFWALHGKKMNDLLDKGYSTVKKAPYLIGWRAFVPKYPFAADGIFAAVRLIVGADPPWLPEYDISLTYYLGFGISDGQVSGWIQYWAYSVPGGWWTWWFEKLTKQFLVPTVTPIIEMGLSEMTSLWNKQLADSGSTLTDVFILPGQQLYAPPYKGKYITEGKIEEDFSIILESVSGK